jgi:hypothetical protein
MVRNHPGPSSTPQHSAAGMVHSIVGGQARTKQTAWYRYVSHEGTQLDPSDEEDEMSASSQSLEKEEGQVNLASEPKEEGQVDLPLESKKE